VDEISVDGKRSYTAQNQPGEQIMTKETAAVLRSFMQNNVSVKYGAENFPGLTVGAKTGTAEVSGQRPNAMLAGFVENEELPLAFIGCVEDAGYGRTVCIPIAAKVLMVAQKVVG